MVGMEAPVNPALWWASKSMGGNRHDPSAGRDAGEHGMTYDAPFAGLKVVDLSQGIAGPYCAMLLAQHGAEVIKVESLGDGDWARTLGTRYGSHTAFSIIGNLGKRSIAVDLKTEAGKQVVWRLVKGADVFLEGFRPGVIKRLGFDYGAVAAREPRLLYLSISGFGQTGPLAERPAMDPVLQAYTGLMNENRGEDGIPHRVPVIVVDMSTALYAFQALSAALYARRDESCGRYIDVSLMQAAAALQSIRLMACHLEGGTMKPGGAPGGVFQIADGWMSIVAINDRDWRSLCAAMEMPNLADEPRFADSPSRLANSDALYAILRPVFAREPWTIWNERLTRARLMHERLNNYADFVAQPHVKETGLIQWLGQAGLNAAVPVPSLPGMPRQENGTPRGTAPMPGQHTRALLAEHGYAEAEIEALLSKGAVAAA
jgi:crotonobetainyl-CoA:carnitine CoA-transferase CaiB-like acyl-CoA transferase